MKKVFKKTVFNQAVLFAIRTEPRPEIGPYKPPSRTGNRKPSAFETAAYYSGKQNISGELADEYYFPVLIRALTQAMYVCMYVCTYIHTYMHA